MLKSAMLKKMRSIFSAPKKIWSKFKSYSLKKKIIVVVVVVIALFMGMGAISNLTKKPEFTTSRVAKSDITETVTETGSIAVSGTVNVYSPTNGITQEVYVKNGDLVEEGEELAKIDSSATQQEQQAAYANYLIAKNTFDAAQADLPALQSNMFEAWDTFRLLAKSGTYENLDGSPRNEQRTLPDFHIAEKDWLAAEAKYKAQAAVVSKGQAQVASTWLLYEATQNATVKAPSAGTVSNLSVSIGSNVSINSAAAPALPILTIVSSKATEMVVSLSEGDVSKVKEGQKAKIEVASLDKIYNGEVKRADSIGTIDAGVIRYNAYLEVIDSDSDLKSGMNADATIITKSLNDVLSVPNSAIKPYQGGRAVRIIKNKKVQYVPVATGVKGDSRTQIISGIEEGQEIISALSNEQLKRPGIFN